MNNLTTIILTYLTIINVVTFFVYGIDKYKAKHAKWRTLLSCEVALDAFVLHSLSVVLLRK